MNRFLVLTLIFTSTTISAQSVLTINASSIKDRSASIKQLTTISAVNENCLIKFDNDQQAFNCLSNVNNSLNNFRNLYIQTLSQKDKSSYFTSVDIATNKNIQGCEASYPPQLFAQFRVPILYCKNKMLAVGLNYNLGLE